MYKQIIIARKDLNMSAGKLAAQVSHASMAFLINTIRKNTFEYCDNKYNAWQYDLKTKNVVPQYYRRDDLNTWAKQTRERGDSVFYARPVDSEYKYGKLELCDQIYYYDVGFIIETDLYEQWINGEFTKVILQAKNKNQLLKAKNMAYELGMVEGEDYFLIRDNCHTELIPEEDGRTLTCIGFKPMDSEIIDKIGKKYHTYIG